MSREYTERKPRSNRLPDHLKLLRVLARMARKLDTDSLLHLVDKAARLRRAA